MLRIDMTVQIVVPRKDLAVLVARENGIWYHARFGLMHGFQMPLKGSLEQGPLADRAGRLLAVAGGPRSDGGRGLRDLHGSAGMVGCVKT